MGSQSLPLYIAMGIALVWTACIMYGAEPLYRRKSPLHIIYWGSWICFALWYKRYTTNNGVPAMHNLIWSITIFFLILGLLFSLFSSQKPPRERYKAPEPGEKSEAEK